MKSRFFFIRLSSALCGTLLLAGCAQHAAKAPDAKPLPELRASYGAWKVSTVPSSATNKESLCYAVTIPHTSLNAPVERTQPYLMVTRRLSGKFEISTSPGFAFSPGSLAFLNAENKAYPLFYSANTAWLKHETDDKALLSALQNNESVTLASVSNSSTAVTDRFSADGFSQALAELKTLCP